MNTRLKLTTGITGALVLMALLLASPVMAQGKLKAQATCPIMDGKINPDLFVDAGGYRIYACCAGCLDKIKADPGAAVAALKAKGEQAEVRVVVCTKCGEIKGTERCCNPEVAKCAKCNMNKGSIGCCKDLSSQVSLCGNCGEVKGSENCCKAGIAKCPQCGLHKGAPGCCAAKDNGVVLCAKCGEVQGSAACCKPGAAKCSGCKLDKGSPGCCKLGALPAACAASAACAVPKAKAKAKSCCGGCKG